MSTIRAVYTNIRAARTAIKDIARLRQIAGVLIRHGLGHVVEAWKLQDKAILSLLLQKRPLEDEPCSLFERIALVLQELGPTFVKLGQILSTRPDLIPQALCDEFKQLQDQVQAISSEEALATLEASLGCAVEEVFDGFNPEPLASASIAQVHTAQLPSGEELVLKIQRPGIKETIKADLHILYFTARQIESAIPEARAFNPVAIVREFERAISKELDFLFEANNLERFTQNFRDWDNIYIPRLYRNWCSDKVLVMERLDGVKITEAMKLDYEMESIAKEAVAMLFKMVFEDGFFHGDLHPGNLFVLRDGRIGLIDFGMVGRMSQAMKDAMADMLLNIATRRYEQVARIFFEIAIRRRKVNYAEWEQDTIDLLERNFSQGSLAEVDFGQVFRDLVDAALRHDASIPPDYTMFFKAMMTVEGIGKTVIPDLDLVAELKPHVERVVAQRYSPERLLRSSADTLQAFARLGQQFPLTAQEFLSQVEDGRLAIGVENTQQQALEAAQDRRWNRGILTLLSSTLLLCGTLSPLETPRLLGMPALSLICYLLGGYLAGRLLWRILILESW